MLKMNNKKLDITFLKFVENIHDYQIKNSVIGIVPKDIGNKEKLFDILEKSLKFPDYFGHNWDALWDLFNDLNWIDNKDIVLVHSDLPLKDDVKNLEIYLEILIEASKNWEEREEHKLTIFFPLNLKQEIEKIIKNID